MASRNHTLDLTCRRGKRASNQAIDRHRHRHRHEWCKEIKPSKHAHHHCMRLHTCPPTQTNADRTNTLTHKRQYKGRTDRQNKHPNTDKYRQDKGRQVHRTNIQTSTRSCGLSPSSTHPVGLKPQNKQASRSRERAGRGTEL